MPTANPDKLHEQAQALRHELKDKGESMDAADRRAKGKRLRRLQRKRRRILTQRERNAPKPTEEKTEE